MCFKNTWGRVQNPNLEGRESLPEEAMSKLGPENAGNSQRRERARGWAESSRGQRDTQGTKKPKEAWMWRDAM